MAGLQADKGNTRHVIVSGEPIEVGLRVLTNEYKWGVVIKVDTENLGNSCGWYCPAWHMIRYDDGQEISMNCDRLSTREPRGF